MEVTHSISCFPYHRYLPSYRCMGLMLLQTYTTLTGDALLEQLPPFLDVGADVTGDPAFSMFNLSLKEDWVDNKTFCHKMCEEHENHEAHETPHEANTATLEAQSRLNANKTR